MIIKDSVCGTILGDIKGFDRAGNCYQILLTEDQLIYNAGYGKMIQYRDGDIIYLDIDKARKPF